MNPLEDGTKHLNVSYQAKTQLGRMLSPPYKAKFKLSDDGEFQSVGGYWCWLIKNEDKLGTLSGEDVLVQKNFPEVREKVSSRRFQEKILRATWHKIRQNQKIFWRFEQNILPFRRYYVAKSSIYRPSDAEWFCDGLEIMSDYIDKNFW